jgi:y4mF family transcriptional regulator
LLPFGYKNVEKENFVPYRVYMNSEIATLIKEKRKKIKLTQRDLADRAGVGLRFIRELEQGKTTLRMDKVNEVLALFGHQLGPVPHKSTSK